MSELVPTVRFHFNAFQNSIVVTSKSLAYSELFQISQMELFMTKIKG